MPFNLRKQRFFALAAVAWLTMASVWSAQSATFTIVNMDDPNEGFNENTPATPVGGNTGVTLGEQRIKVFEEAGRQWGALLQSAVDIRVEAQFNPLPAGVLGSAGPRGYFRDFPNAPVPNTFFPQALANALAGQDQDPNSNDIFAQFSSTFTFYMGFDHLVPSGQVDLLVVLLHEMGHGLGFLTVVNGATGAKFNGADDHYMRFLIDESTGLQWPDMSDAQRAASAENNGGLQWSGAFAKAAAAGLSAGNGSLGPRMYAPSMLAGGSSVSHFDTVLTPSDLMEPFITSQPQQFMTEALFRDIGWPFNDGGGGPISMRITDTMVVEGNNGITMMDFELTLSGATNSPVTVNFTTADDTAIAGSDYIADNGVFTFPANATTATLTVLVQTDSIQEPDERFFVNLSGAVGVILSDSQAIGTIVDDDGIEATIEDVNITEGNSGLNNATFTVSLSGGTATQSVSINYATADGTATDGSDYTGTSGTLVFPPGFLSMDITVPVAGDTLPEPDESFFVNLTGSTNAVISDFQAIGTIVNDDSGSVLSIAKANLTELNTGSRDMVFQVTLLPPATTEVTVDFATSDGTATAGADYTAASGTLTFPAGATNRTVNVQILGDTVVESNETLFVTLSNAAGAFINIAQATGTIVEDDGGFISDLVVTRNTNAFDLARAITGSDSTGLAIKEIRLTAHTDSAMAASAGLFELLGEAPHTYGLSDPGVVISTGDVLDYESGISADPANTTAYGPGGFLGAPATIQQEALLDPITTSGGVNFSHYDATQLDIRFDAPEGFNQVSFRVSFGSEEYPIFVGSEFIDGFGIYLNGTNIAFTGGAPININHPDMQPLPGTELNGVIAQGASAVLQFNALIQSGSKNNTLTFIIADTEDGALDSTVYISSLKASAPFTAGTAPTIASVSPLRAPVGAEITITGNNFGETPGDNIVFIGPARAEVISAAPTLLKVKAPLGASYGVVTVTANGLTASSPLPFSGAFASSGIIDQDAYDPSVDFLSGGVPEDVVVGDLDNDGRPDLAAVNFDSNQITIFRNVTIPTSVSAGSFTTGIDLPTAADPSHLAIGDLNGDGLLDLVVVCNGAEVVSVFQNTTENGFISFSPGFDFAVGSDPRGVAIGDLDQDGRLDIAVAESGSGFVSVLKNVRNSSDIGIDSFSDRVRYLVGSIPVSVAIGDITGDRIPDLAVANSFDGPGGNSISILRNLGVSGAIDSGSFTVRQNIPASPGPPGTSAGPTDLELADMDNDGLLDIVTANSRQQIVAIHLNKLAMPGTFDTPRAFSSGLSTRRLAVADIDGDSLLDIAVANPGINALTLLKNSSTLGMLEFAPTSEHALPGKPLGVAFADLDQNGKPELVTPNSNGSVSVLRNTMRSTSGIVSWNPNPSTLVHGQPLTSAQLNAVKAIDGTFIYNPPAGTILPAGMNEVVATLVPDDFINNSIETATRTITVTKATPVLTWPNPADIPFGTPLGAAELNATSTAPGTFVYTPPAGTVLGVENGLMLLVDFIPDAPENFNSAGAATVINIVRADPNIVWNTPPPIEFGEPVTAALHLNATVAPTVAGAFAYSVPADTILPVGSHNVTATFTPSEPGNYNSVMATVTIEVVAATPIIAWATPPDITFGEPLTEIDHLNPMSDVDGSFTFMPPAGTILSAGAGQALTATFTPTDPSQYNGATATVIINVNKADVAVNWPAPTDIIFGTALNTADHLNALFTPSAGTVVYTPAEGVVLNAGDAQTLSVTISPDDNANYNVTTASQSITVLKKDPVITWPHPADIVFGTALNVTDHLAATADVPGEFVYSPAAGTVLDAGLAQSLTVQFTPDDTVNYNATPANALINVTPAEPVITWNNPADIVYGTLLNATDHLNATANTPGQFTYAPFGDGAQLDAGANQTLSASFAPDSPNFSPKMATTTLNVLKADPAITWDDPMDIEFGTQLGAAQLNATASAAGVFTYTPPAGTAPPTGAGQTLSAEFTPTDTANYNNVSATATINVNPATPAIIWGGFGNEAYPFTLPSSRLNATTVGNIPGSFVYTPPAGTEFNAGDFTLSVTFTPDDLVNYSPATATMPLTVTKALPPITWADPDDITFGTLLDETQLNASSPLPGSFVYDPPAGTQLNAETGKRLSVTFTPTDLQNYLSKTGFADLNILKATPEVTWETPAAIKFGAALGTAQLNATASVPGQFAYNPDLGAILPVGASQLLTVTFTPDDPLNYNSANGGALITVDKGDPDIVWNNPADIDFGTALSGAQLNAQTVDAGVTGQFVYTPPAGTQLNAGVSQTLSATFTPDNTTDYNPVTRSVVINVRKINPAVDWPAPADIPYETPLGAQQLNATADVSGFFSYSPPAGAILNAGNDRTLRASFTPTDSINYNAIQVSTLINVTKLAPTLSWNSPASIEFGAPLTGSQLNAISDVEGEFVYTPPAGTILGAGTALPLQAQFTPADTGNYDVGTVATTIDVTPAEPAITWSNPSDIVFGQALKNDQLNATANVPGDFVYTPPLSTILNAGSAQPLRLTFTPTDTVNYTPVSAGVLINVLKADPVLSWQNPAGIVFGAALDGTQLNAMSDIAGSFTYTPPAGSILNAGPVQILSAVFTPDESANFNGGNIAVTIDVAKANANIAWSPPAPITFGTALGAEQLSATAAIAGAFSYSPPLGSVLSAGAGQALNVDFTPSDSQNYNPASASVTIDILQAASTISWRHPADIVQGAPLTAAQLNATADVAGTFVYNPGLGTILPVGDNQTLEATFTPDDSFNFAGAAAEVLISVKPSNLPPTVAIVSPSNGRSVLPLVNLTITASAADDGAIAKVEFFEGSNKLGESAMAPFSVIWPAVPLGSYTLTAVATDDTGQSTTSSAVNIAAQAGPTEVMISQTTGEVTVGLVGEPGVAYDVQVSSDLRMWMSIGTFTGTGGPSSFHDSTIAAQVGQRFYRLVQIP